MHLKMPLYIHVYVCMIYNVPIWYTGGVSGALWHPCEAGKLFHKGDGANGEGSWQGRGGGGSGWVTLRGACRESDPAQDPAQSISNG